MILIEAPEHNEVIDQTQTMYPTKMISIQKDISFYVSFLII